MRYINLANFFISFVLLTSCNGVYSQYSSDLINDKKICFLSKIDSEYSRLFIRKVNEFPYVGRYPNCDYLVLLGLFEKRTSIRTSVGLKLHNEVHIEAKYSIFKIDKEKYNQVEDIFYNQVSNAPKRLTGSKNSYAMKGVHSDEEREELDRYNDLLLSYDANIGAMDGLMTKINDGDMDEFATYALNPILVTSEIQSRVDTQNMLAEKLAERVVNNVVLDIVRWNDSERFRFCKNYYNEYISNHIYGNVNDIDVKNITEQCKDIWKKIKKDSEKILQNVSDGNNTNEANETNIDVVSIREDANVDKGNSNEIENKKSIKKRRFRR